MKATATSPLRRSARCARKSAPHAARFSASLILARVLSAPVPTPRPGGLAPWTPPDGVRSFPDFLGAISISPCGPLPWGLRARPGPPYQRETSRSLVDAHRPGFRGHDRRPGDAAPCTPPPFALSAAGRTVVNLPLTQPEVSCGYSRGFYVTTQRQRKTSAHHIVTMRISPQEAATIRQLAQSRGETVSAMMRSALLHNRPRLTRIDLRAVARLLGSLARLARTLTRSLTISTPAVPATASRAGWVTRCAICRSCALVRLQALGKEPRRENSPAMRTDAADPSRQLTAPTPSSTSSTCRQ